MLKGFIQKARCAAVAPDRVNRYMAQLVGIYNVGAYFPELKQAQGFREFALRGIELCIDEEFYPDCISKELCPDYHGGNRGAIQRIIANARLMGYETPAKLMEGLEMSYDFYPRVATPLFGLPQFGDTWGRGRLDRTFEAALSTIDKPVYRWFATQRGEGSPPEFVSTRLPWAGFYVMRSGWDKRSLYLCLDVGPLGQGHWHEDFGNFECYAYGEPLISEVGVDSYTANRWCAPGHGKLAPAPMLSLDQEAMNHAVHDTVVLPLDVGVAADLTIERLAVVDEQRAEVGAVDVCALRITTPSGVDYYLSDLRQR